jgi:hypothetical protein
MAPVEPPPVAPAPEETVRRAAVSPAILRTVAWAWIAILIAGSLQPARPSLVRDLHREIHWVAFLGAALLLFALAKTRLKEMLWAGTVFLLGGSLEVMQHLIYGNHLEWRDIADDGLAVLAAFALYRLTGAWKPRRTVPTQDA